MLLAEYLKAVYLDRYCSFYISMICLILVVQESNVYLFADDAKLFRHISGISDNMKLQTSVDSVKAWSDRRMLKLNYNKCKVVSFGRRTSNDFTYSISDRQEFLL